jgi:hypothetical protein
MNRSLVTLFACGALALILFPLGILKPGMPLTLKADEPAYYMMAMSLARDGDLQTEVKDIQRLFDEFPRLPAKNVILMTDDGWNTVYFGKPYIYALVNAPAAALFGANGMVAMNMLMLSLMIWLGFVYLRQYNDDFLALGFVAGFFVLSSAFAYTYWLHPEIFNMTSVMLCLFFAFHRFERDEEAPAGRWRRLVAWASGDFMVPIWSGAALAFGVYNKPMLLAFSLPALWLFWRRFSWGGAIRWMAAFAVALGLICGLSVALTGHPSAYLGVWRAGPPIEDQNAMPELPVGAPDAEAAGRPQNSWEWLIRIPRVPLPLMMESAGYFLIGRHTGLFAYMPFSLVALALFLIHRRGSRARWATVIALASIAFYFLLFINFNWHGGGGFVGNRYFVMAYPAFLFLITAIRPRWLAVVGFALGGLFLGGILTTPFGAPVRNPTLQAHVRNHPFTMLPLEFSLRHQTPGYWGDLETEGWFWGRKDNMRPHGNEFLLHGGQTVEMWMMMTEPMDQAVFQFKNEATDNEVVVRLGSDKQVLHFEGPGAQQVTLTPGKPYKIRNEKNDVRNHIYRLRVDSQRSQIIVLETVNGRGEERRQSFPLGVRMAYLGTPEDLASDIYHIDWNVSASPEIVSANAIFELEVEATNASEAPWRHKGAPRVQLSYHWLDAEGGSAVREGQRSELPSMIQPGESASVRMEVLAPPTPGRYVLELDAVRERVSWFSRANPDATYRIEVEVVDLADAAAETTP